MGAVAFHSGVSDKLGYTCRLVRKVWRQGQQVVVTGSPDQLARLDALLWSFEAGEFLPHARLLAGLQLAPQLARTPVLLADRADDCGHAEVLINLGPAFAECQTDFARVVEVVATSDDEVQSGRRRWRQYLAQGNVPINHPAG